MNSIDAGLQFQKLLWLGIIVLAAIFMGTLLAQSAYFLALLSGLALWLAMMPYHAKMSVAMAVSTFGAALILPMPGRPTWWEFGAMMGWTGIVLLIALRRYSPHAAWMVRRNIWLFAGVVAYCLVLLMIMKLRGVGFRILGGAQIGGRLYFQQLLCAVFPLLFALQPIGEKQLTTLFSFQCLLTATYLVSDFIFSYGGTGVFALLYFFELPGDGINFESQSAQFGIRRFQSLYLVAEGFLMFLLIRRNLSDFTRARTLWVWPIALAIMGIGLLGGHRYLLVLVALLLVVVAFAQKFFSTQRVLVASALMLLVFGFLVGFADRLPLAAQRAISLVPAINVSRVAREDGDITWQGRKDLRRLGWELAPQYRWVGRGFRKNELMGGQYDPFLFMRDPDTFFNGFVGLLVNTGIPGTTAMMVVILAGSVCAWRVIRFNRIMSVDDNFARMSTVVAGHWFATAIIFIFLHGDSEFAMRVFALPASILMVCDLHLRRRFLAQSAPEERPIMIASPKATALNPAAGGPTPIQPLPA